MKITDFSTQHTILNQFLSELRDVTIQQDSLRFRRNIERIGEIMAYEISRDLPCVEKAIRTPLAEATENVPGVRDIHIEYIASPKLDGKTLILTDTMLATGASMEYAYEALLTKGMPAHIHIASVIASRQAVEHIRQVFPQEKTSLWCGTIDPELNAHSYIVPGLGDAGDLCYGEKE